MENYLKMRRSSQRKKKSHDFYHPKKKRLFMRDWRVFLCLFIIYAIRKLTKGSYLLIIWNMREKQHFKENIFDKKILKTETVGLFVPTLLVLLYTVQTHTVFMYYIWREIGCCEKYDY